MGSLYLVLRSLSQEPAEAEDKNGFSSSLTVSRAVRAITGAERIRGRSHQCR